ncbi:MAG: hypothetical protein JW891_08040 [Candidatus Lokiarchaeota archaeon]|nr:hypothetical protein [Candidatus Lokiarchaeota archaeon]
MSYRILGRGHETLGSNDVLRKKFKDESVVEEPTNFYNIWKTSPCFKDSNLRIIYIKSGLVIAVLALLSVYIWLEFNDLLLTLVLVSFSLILFLIAFKDEIFKLAFFSTFRLRSVTKLNPFKNFRFWQLKTRSDVVFYSNHKDLISVGLKIFKISIVPENVNPNMNSFFKYLNSQNVPFTYQVIQAPLINFPVVNATTSKNTSISSSISSMKTSIYFCFYYDFKGMLNARKLRYLMNTLDEYISTAKSGFKANFHHFRIIELKGLELINALRTFFLGTDVPPAKDVKQDYGRLIVEYSSKITYLILVFTVLTLFMWKIGAGFHLSIATGALVAFIHIILFWKSIFFKVMLSNFQDSSMTIINPFQDVFFYWLSGTPSTLYSLVNKKLLIGTKFFNMARANPPFFGFQNRPLARPDSFFQSIIPLRIPFTYTGTVAPMLFQSFESEARKLLNQKTQTSLNSLRTLMERETFMNMRGGIWRCIFTLSTSEYKHVTEMNVRNALELEVSLSEVARELINSYQTSLPNYRITLTQHETLLSACLLTLLKNKFFRTNGSNLVYLLQQGKTLTNLIDLFPQLKKGLEVKIASEFNTPLYLENFVVLGNTINTEVLESEVQAGFTFEQVQNLLFLNGFDGMKEKAMMKTVIQLVKNSVPCIVFDHTGEWSKLLKHFKNSRYEENLAFFKLGKSYTIDLIRSDLPYDTENPSYLDFVADAYSISFRKDERIMEAFKRSISKLEKDFDINSIKLDIETNPEWNTNPATDSLRTLFEDLTGQEMAFFVSSEQGTSAITTLDFINDDSTIIIDLSILNDIRRKVFASFLIAAKIIHISRHSDILSSVGQSVREKILVIPHIDAFFEESYLNKMGNYGKIDKFLGSLFNLGFGVIASANKARYLHEHAFSFFKNLATFRIFNKCDASYIGYSMNFRKLHGSGIYSSSRNETFQINYLSTMTPAEIVVKRSDIDQPFPVQLDLDELKDLRVPSQKEIVAFMKNQGYDMEFAEKEIARQANKTLFEKDFEIYSGFVEDIVKFLNGLKTIHKVGNLSERRVKEELMKYIYNKASKIVKKRKFKHKINKIRDDLFSILVQHDYLVEQHPLEASGAESLRSSYSVGEKFERALKDYFEAKESALLEIPEVISFESKDREPEIIYPRERDQNHEKREKRNIYMNRAKNSISLFLQDIFTIYRSINTRNYKDALEQEKKAILNFMTNIAQGDKEKDFNNKALESLFEYLGVILNIDWALLAIDILNKCRLIETKEDPNSDDVILIYDNIKELHSYLQVIIEKNKSTS